MAKKTKRPERIYSQEKGVKAYAIRPRTEGDHQDGRWYWQFVMHVDRKRVTVHPAGYYTRDEAMQVVLQYRPKSRQITSISTVDHLMRVWLLSRKQAVAAGELKPSSYKAYRLAQKRLSAFGAKLLLTRLHERELVMLRRQLAAKYSDRTTRQTMDLLRAAWIWGQALGYTEYRPLPRLKWPDKPEAVYNTYCPETEEAAAIYEWLCEAVTRKGRTRPKQGRRTRLLYLATWMLGCREEELCNLRWGQLDLEAGTITLLRKGSKGRKRQVTLELAPLLVQEFADFQPETSAPDDNVFRGASPKAIHTTLYMNMRRACTALELPQVTPHGLRRLAATILYEKLGPKEYEYWMGHTHRQGGTTYAKARPVLVSAAPGLLGPNDGTENDVIPFRPAKRR